MFVYWLATDWFYRSKSIVCYASHIVRIHSIQAPCSKTKPHVIWYTMYNAAKTEPRRRVYLRLTLTLKMWFDHTELSVCANVYQPANVRCVETQILIAFVLFSLPFIQMVDISLFACHLILSCTRRELIRNSIRDKEIQVCVILLATPLKSRIRVF